HMQSLSEWRAVPIDHGKRSDLDPNGVDDQGAAFVMANRISIPGWRHIRRMRLVQAHLAELMIKRIKDRDFVHLLENLHSKICNKERYLFGPTLVARGGVALTGQRHVTELLHDVRGPRLQDRIVEIADQLGAIASAGLRSFDPSRRISHWART